MYESIRNRLLSDARSLLALVCIMGLLCHVVEAAEPARADTPPAKPTLDQVVGSLLQRVEGSGCVFIRNGKKHKPKAAAAHMRKKYEHFQDEIKTPDDFIRLAATRSLVSKKPYEVILPGGERKASAAWMHAMLATNTVPVEAE